MGWRGTIRAIEAAERRAQRGEQRRFKELQRRNKELAKLSALEQARLEVETYVNQLEVLLSIHKEQGNEWDWHGIAQSLAPMEPLRGNRLQTDAAARHALYEPGFFDRLFGKAKKQAAAFEAEMEWAKTRDERDFEAAWAQYQKFSGLQEVILEKLFTNRSGMTGHDAGANRPVDFMARLRLSRSCRPRCPRPPP